VTVGVRAVAVGTGAVAAAGDRGKASTSTLQTLLK
jgi:hypothetical protein